MTNTYLRFTPLYGAKSSDPYCYLLKIGTATVLLDCGWNDKFDVRLLEPVIKVLPQVDVVLLSHPDTNHLGALPYLVRKAGLKAPVYAAAPVAKLGPMFMYDHYTSLHAVSDFDLFTTEDIDMAFESTNTLKHHQYIILDLKGQQLKIVGYPAGHMVGGTVWILESGGEVVVYGVNTNHQRERLLNAGEFDKLPSRPALLITDAARSRARLIANQDRNKSFAAALLSVLRGDSTAGGGGPRRQSQHDSRSGPGGGLRVKTEVKDSDGSSKGGSVLLPVDTAGRMLEILLVLDKIWQSQGKARLPYHIVVLSCVATSTLTAARGLLEYMSAELQGEFCTTCNNPLNIRTLQFAHSVADVVRMGEGPKVVLATGEGMDYGMARQLLLHWGTNARNAVIFTQQPRPGTFAADLLALGPRAGMPAPRNFTLTVAKRVPLEGEELEAYEAARAAAEAEAVAAAGDDDEAAALPLRESSAVNTQLNRSNTGGLEQVLMDNTADMFEDTNMVDEDVLIDGFVPPKTAMYCMFPDEQEAVLTKWDEWGAVIDTSDLRTTEEVDAGTTAADEDELEVDETPTKVVTEHITFSMQATVSFVEDFSGCSDGHSLRNNLAKLAPRALVLIGADEQTTGHMAAACSKQLPAHQTRVFTPGPGEELSLPMASSYPIAVNAQLLHGLSKHTLKVGDGDKYEVAWIEGHLGSVQGSAAAAAESADGAASSSAQAQQQLEQQQQQKQFACEANPDFVLQPPGTVTTKTLDDPPLATATPAASEDSAAPNGGEAMEVDEQAGQAAVEGPAATTATADAAVESAEDLDHNPAACGDHGGIFIGNVQLSQLKSALSHAGFPCEFMRGGQPQRLLVCGSLIVTTDTADGQLVMEGPLCDEYFSVRDVVYGQYNVC